jgi:hypothetical protein
MAVVQHAFCRAGACFLARVTVGVWLFLVAASALAMWGAVLAAAYGITTSVA